MTSLARRHHFLPQGYLAGFTDTGRKNGWLHAVDLATNRSFRTKPLNVAVEKDFKRIDLDGCSPDAIESALGPLENQAIQAIRRVVESQNFPDERDHNWILNLISLLAAQNPTARRKLNIARKIEAKRKLEHLVSSPAIWSHYKDSARRAGEELPYEVEYSRALEFVKDHGYSIEFSSEGTLRAEFANQDSILMSLGRRTWSVLLTPPTGPFFITSDHPFSVVLKPGAQGTPHIDNPDTEFLFPLSRTTAFIGVYDSELKPVVHLASKAIAIMNSRTVHHADRRLFLPDRRFIFFGRGKVREVHV